MTKITLRKFLSSFFNEKDLQTWFDPLTLEYTRESNILTIGFPHPLFGKKFFMSVKKNFEKYIITLNHDIIFHYLTPDNFSVLHSSSSFNKEKLRIIDSNKVLQKNIPQRTNIGTCLREEYTLDTFIYNKKNEFPMAAVRELLKSPTSPSYIPFVIYGASGTGKTHLLSAMANSIKNEFLLPFYINQAINILSITEDIYSLPWKAYFLDDFHSIAGNDEAQEKFTILFDLITAQKSLLILCMDTSPLLYKNINQKVRMRLSSGLSIELKYPDLDVRYKYVQKKSLGLQLTKETSLSIAQRYSDFRAIDGVLNKIRAYDTLVKTKNKDISALLDMQGGRKTLTASTIISITSEFFNLSPEDITGKNKNKNITHARWVAAYLCRELLGIPLAQVGKYLGNRDHSSILYAIKKIQQLQQSNKETNNSIAKLKKMCLENVTLDKYVPNS